MDFSFSTEIEQASCEQTGREFWSCCANLTLQVLTGNLQALLNIFWHVSSLFSGCFFFLNPCIVQMLLQVAGMLQINLLILQNHQPLVIVFSSFVNVTPNTQSILLLSDLCPYSLISNSIIIPVSQCATSHFPKKRRVFLK